MRVFAIGDLHLSFHADIDKPMDAYGESWENHTERLKANWEEIVGDDDLVIVAGDVSWGLKLNEAVPDLEWIDSLPGYKLITKGNHDLWWSGITRLNRMFEKTKFLQNKALLFGDALITATRGWVCPGSAEFSEDDMRIYKREVGRLNLSINDALEIEKTGQKIAHKIGVLHYPPTNDRYEESEFTKTFSKWGADQVVYGHLHGMKNYKKGIRGERDGVEYKLVSLDYIDAIPALLYDSEVKGDFIKL